MTPTFGTSLIERYRAMFYMRRFEEACLSGVADREIHGELHLGTGQEAIAAGMIGPLNDGDAVVSTHRNHLHGIAKGVDPYRMMAEIFERSTGLCGGFGGHMHLFDASKRFSTTGIVGATLPVALGHAYASHLRGDGTVAVGVSGDGGVNTGGFHESLNLAGAWGLPLVVLVENNEWAISVPHAESSATATVAERASAYNAWGRRVDGLDVMAVADAFAEVVTHARSGGGPAILEATCYRFRGHYEGDPDVYRSAEEREARRTEADPLKLTRARLAGEAVSDLQLGELERAVELEIDDMVARVRRDPWPDAATAHQHVFAKAAAG